MASACASERRHDAFLATVACLEAAQFAVVAEAAARHVDGGDNLLHGGARRAEVLRIGNDHVHRRAERGASIRTRGHEPPLTVLAEDELPELAEPVDSDDDPVGVDVGVAVGVADALDDATDDVATSLAGVEDPACVCAATSASAATEAVPSTPNAVVSLPRRRSARSRSATVMRRFGAAITVFPSSGIDGAGMHSAPLLELPEASGAHRADP